MTEFQEFITTLSSLGISHTVRWRADPAEWQKIILDAGYNLTATSCVIVSTIDTEYLFSIGEAYWTVRPNKGHGPQGVFLLSRSKSTQKVTERLSFNARTKRFKKPSGLGALKRKYPGSYPKR